MSISLGKSISRARRDKVNTAFVVVCIIAASMSVVVLAILLGSIAMQGTTYLNAEFFESFPSRNPEDAGIRAALFGSIWICIICASTALPLGVGTAVFLEEFRPTGRIQLLIHKFIELNIRNLAGVPSIVYGILGLTAFVQLFGLGNPREPFFTFPAVDFSDADAVYDARAKWYYIQLPFGRSVLAGGLTLMLVVLPIVIIAAQEALRAVPGSLRHGSFALGSTRWQMVRRITLPAAIPGIMTGSILAMSRAIGEAAPILVIAGVIFIRFTPLNLMDDFTALPLQIYDWAGRPNEDFHKVAASGIIALLAVLLSFNLLAVLIRQKFQKPLQ